jgi:DsbC/DsbD-like thiol-disulfide interchange protein
MRLNATIFGMARTAASAAVILLATTALWAQNGGAAKSDSVVKISARLSPEAPGVDGKQVLTIDLDISEGWHIYANPPGQEDFASVQTTVNVTAGKKLQSIKVGYPKGTVINDSVIGRYYVYEGKQTIKATLTRAPGDTGALQVTVKFQPCNDKQCLLPASKKLTVP